MSYLISKIPFRHIEQEKIRELGCMWKIFFNKENKAPDTISKIMLSDFKSCCLTI